MKRFGIIGDVHTEADALQQALSWLRTQDVDQILCTGDIADGPGDAEDVARCCALLSDYGVQTICGNHDRWVTSGEMRELEDATDGADLDPETRDYLICLPATQSFDTIAGKMLLCHGTGNDDMRGVKPFDRGAALVNNTELQRLIDEAEYSLIIAGHTHMRMARRVGGMTIVNAGTLHPDFSPCFCVLDLAQMQVDYLGFDEDGEVVALKTMAVPTV